MRCACTHAVKVAQTGASSDEAIGRIEDLDRTAVALVDDLPVDQQDAVKGSCPRRA
jgi:hypothetical protein